LAAAASARGITLSETASAELVAAWGKLSAWPDTREALAAFRARGLRLAPLANFAPTMLDDLLRQANLSSSFDAVISTDRARTFKPDPKAYALGPAVLGLPREEIAFAAFGGWDAAGARWFGFRTFWVNRLGVAADELDPGPHASGPDLAALAAFVDEERQTIP
jgi:2-haloacid dehalogenase